MPDLDRWENEGGQVFNGRSHVRLKTLQRRHAALDVAVESELSKPSPCTIELRRLRREKLFLNDEMRQLGL